MKNPAIKYGVILGLISVFVQWLLYAAGDEMMATWWIGIVWMIAIIVLVVVFSLRMRKEKGGYWTFGNAFVSILIMCTISGVITTANNVVMYGVVDTELAERLKEITIQKTASMMERFGAPQEEVDKTIEKMQTAPSQFSVMSQIKGFFIGLIVMSVIALIIAAIIKKNPPMSNSGAIDSFANS